MNKIKWIAPDTTGDKCGIYNNKYVDIVASVDNTWSYYYNNQRIEGDLPSRDVAEQKLIEYLAANNP